MSALASAARFECNERLRLYPALINKRRIEVSAAVIDTECWDRIALAFEAAVPIMSMLSKPGYPVVWSDILAAIDQAERTRISACVKKPEDIDLLRRRDTVASIAAQVRPVAKLFLEVMEQLRPRAMQAIAA